MIDISAKLVELAPLTRSFAIHLANYLRKSLPPREIGRPRRAEGDVLMRTEKQIFDALDQLLPLVQNNREEIYSLIDPLVKANELTQKHFLPILNRYTPKNMMIYPHKLKDWPKKNLLFYDAPDKINPQIACCILLSRIIDTNRTGWLPRPPDFESFWCWRYDAVDAQPAYYELPLVAFDPEHPNVLKPTSAEGPSSFLLITPWKGAGWDSPVDWLISNEGAIRWVGEPGEGTLALWLTAQEREQLIAPVDGKHIESLARQALHILANRLKHPATSS